VRALALAVAACAAFLVLLAGAAHAATVSVDGAILLVRAESGEANELLVALSDEVILVADAAAPLAAGDGCAAVEGGVECDVAGLAVLHVEAGDGDDGVTVEAAGLRVEVDAGAGDDTVDAAAATGPAALAGGAGSDLLEGGAGADVLDGAEGNDVLRGGAGNDSLTGGAGTDSLQGEAGGDTLLADPGADVLTGGAGVDTVSYASRTASVAVSLDGKRNDGGRRERDRVDTDVENVTGGSGNDVLYGSPLRNVLAGGGGNDTILGFEGADRLEGGDGHDILVGGPGNDQLRAGPGSDYCNVGPDGGTTRDCERYG
jgi:Ca2+-binding RTX toxin-like protein